MRTVCIVQARTGSTRLPGKVMMDLSGESMLGRVVNRAQRSRMIDEVVIATTTLPSDDVIENLCSAKGWPCFRGSEQDVLDRYYKAAIARGAEAVVRITSDCPLIDPSVVDLVVREFHHHQPKVDYASNVLPRRTFPYGLDTEVFSFSTLERAWREDKNPSWREHVTTYIYRNPDIFSIHCVTSDGDYSHLRWTVDTAEDMELTRKVYNQFQRDDFSWHDVLALFSEHPEWSDINRHVQQKVV